MRKTVDLVVVLGVLVLVSGGSAFASDPSDGNAPDAVQLGPLCLRVAQASPVRAITNLKLVVETTPEQPFVFGILGQEFGGSAISLFTFGMGFRFDPQVVFLLTSLDVVGGKLLGRGFSGALNVATLQGTGRCIATDVAGGCGKDGVNVSYEPVVCP